MQTIPTDLLRLITMTISSPADWGSFLRTCKKHRDVALKDTTQLLRRLDEAEAMIIERQKLRFPELYSIFEQAAVKSCLSTFKHESLVRRVVDTVPEKTTNKASVQRPSGSLAQPSKMLSLAESYGFIDVLISKLADPEKRTVEMVFWPLRKFLLRQYWNTFDQQLFPALSLIFKVK